MNPAPEKRRGENGGGRDSDQRSFSPSIGELGRRSNWLLRSEFESVLRFRFQSSVRFGSLPIWRLHNRKPWRYARSPAFGRRFGAWGSYSDRKRRITRGIVRNFFRRRRGDRPGLRRGPSDDHNSDKRNTSVQSANRRIHHNRRDHRSEFIDSAFLARDRGSCDLADFEGRKGGVKCWHRLPLLRAWAFADSFPRMAAAESKLFGGLRLRLRRSPLLFLPQSRRKTRSPEIRCLLRSRNRSSIAAGSPDLRPRAEQKPRLRSRHRRR